jgi:hypothetical protein
VVAYYFQILNPLDGFRLEGDRLLFENRGETEGLAGIDGYEYQWFSYDNASGRATPVGEVERGHSPDIPIPSSGAEFIMARLRTLSAAEPSWKKSVDVTIRLAPKREVVGIDREE